jgi:DNA-binding MarR family transcriptional regulator
MVEIIGRPGRSATLGAVDGERERLRTELVELMHRYSLANQQLGDAFAQQHGLHPTDLQALIAVLRAERGDEPLTPGRLGETLGLSSGATTAVIDRLERVGHLRRTRESSDRRVVHLRYGAPAKELASSFFRPLAERSHEVTDDFTTDELETVRRFLMAMTEAVADHHHAVRSGS